MNLRQLLAERAGLAKVAGGIMWLAWIASVVIGGGVFDSQQQLIGADHLAFYSAARLIEDGNGARVYDYNFLADYQSEMIGRRFLDAYRNPPFYALLYLPTAPLPYIASFWIWSAVSLVLLWFALRWLAVPRTGTAYLWALSFYPVFAAISFGQNSLLSFAAFALTFFFLERKRPFCAGLAAGLLLYKPQLLLCMCFWWALELRTYWRVLAGLTVTGLALLVISFLVIPNETKAFITNLKSIADYDAFWFYNLHTPRGFWTLLFEDDKQLGKILGFACSLIAFAAFVLFWRRWCGDMPMLFAAAVFVTLWASPHTMIYDWSLALIPAILLWYRRPELRASWLPLFAVGWLVLFVSTPLTKYQTENFGGALVVKSIPTETGELHLRIERREPAALQISVPILAVLGWLAARRLNAGQSSQSQVKS